MAINRFRDLIGEITADIAGVELNQQLADHLNRQFPAGGEQFAAIERACHQAIEDGWMCENEAGGIRYGRVIRAEDEARGFSVDVVRMKDVKGPHHRHPRGEINMIMPLLEGACFDGHAAGWWVYEPGSAHFPTVSGGEALVLYLLPGGSIEFTRA